MSEPEAALEVVPKTLETPQPRNLPLCRRHGFEISRELPPPSPGGPVVGTMKPPAAPDRPEVPWVRSSGATMAPPSPTRRCP